MTFTTALQSHLATQNLTKPPRFTKMLGLGGKHFLNFRRDPLQPILGLETEDYVTFGGVSDFALCHLPQQLCDEATVLC